MKIEILEDVNSALKQKTGRRNTTAKFAKSSYACKPMLGLCVMTAKGRWM